MVMGYSASKSHNFDHRIRRALKLRESFLEESRARWMLLLSQDEVSAVEFLPSRQDIAVRAERMSLHSFLCMFYQINKGIIPFPIGTIWNQEFDSVA